MTKSTAREVFKNFEIFQNEVYTIDDNDKDFKIHYIEYYVWYGMLISFSRNNKNKEKFQ